MHTTGYEPVIGLEIHCRLGAKTKLFCACAIAEDGAPPNTSICPVCTGQPGALPALNRFAVELAVRAASALNCAVNSRSVFARKNYFYPDLSKGYQISQYEQPLAGHGRLAIEIKDKDGQTKSKNIGITRVHMEEDAGKLLHALGSRELDYSLVDFNRGGAPLIEIVSEPDIRSADEAYEYLSELKKTLKWIGVSNCDMEKGELRCDVNLSLRKAGEIKFGVKVEIKNLNSFKAVKDAAAYEISRQTDALEAGGKIIQETRLWDDQEGKTLSMRSKEEAHDYRYFPDPDLVPLAVDPQLRQRVAKDIPELPAQVKNKFKSEYGLSDYDAGVLTSDKGLTEYFDKCAKGAGADKNFTKLISSWITTELLGRLNAEKKDISQSRVLAEALNGLLLLIKNGKISGKMGKEVFDGMWTTGKSAEEIVESSGLAQVSDSAQIEAWAKEAVSENPKAADDVRKGSEKAIGALVGAVMKKSKGKANPAMVNAALKSLLVTTQ